MELSQDSLQATDVLFVVYGHARVAYQMHLTFV